MDAVDLCYLPLADVAELLQRRAVSPVEIAHIAGPDSADPTTLGIAAPRVAEALRTRRADLRDIRVAVLVDHRAAVLDPDVGASFDRAVVDLVQLGAEVRDVALPEERAALDAGLLVLLAEAAAVHVPWLRERPDEYGADVRAQLER